MKVRAFAISSTRRLCAAAGTSMTATMPEDSIIYLDSELNKASLTFALFFGENVRVRDALRAVTVANSTRVFLGCRIDSPIATNTL